MLMKSFSEVNIGDKVNFSKTITESDAALYMATTGDFGPIHINEAYAKTTMFQGRLAPGIMVAGMATSVLTDQLVGLKGVSIEDTFYFLGPVKYGDTVYVEVKIVDKIIEKRIAVWEAIFENQDQKVVLKISAKLKFPREKV